MNHFNSEQLATWQRNGYLLIASPFSLDEVKKIQQWVTEIAAWPTEPGKSLHYYEQVNGNKTLSRTENFLPFHPQFNHFLRNSIVFKLLEQIIGEPVILFKEKINYKFTGTGKYNPHQDIHAYDTSHLAFQEYHINCAIAVDSSSLENGCFQIVPGFAGKVLDRNPDGSIVEKISQKLNWTPIEMQPGDILIFNCWVPHKSERNLSANPRRVLYLTFNGISKGDLREAHYLDRSSGKAKTREINPELFIDV